LAYSKEATYLMKRIVPILFTVLVVVGCVNVNKGTKVGPELLTEAETKKLVINQGIINTIDSISMSTAGPIYRLVIGKDKNGSSIAVWVDKNIVYSINMDQGLSKDEVLELSEKKGLTGAYETQLVYVPKIIEENEGLAEGVYWWVKGKGKSISFNFHSGEVSKETGNDNNP
jgi:uncharacterized protein YpmB